jgi:NAD(P)-dependent dehydrogenase (short-subunit alcohol dehydrogenase family)
LIFTYAYSKIGQRRLVTGPDRDWHQTPFHFRDEEDPMHANTKIAIVTGAGTGIGRASALALLQAGYAVVLAGRRVERLQAAVAEAGPLADQALVVPADVRDPASVQALFATTQERFGRLDLLFNNAGIGSRAAPLEDLDLDNWRATLDVNLTGTFLCLQAAFRLMKSQTPQGGRIINNGSISAHAPRPNLAAYTASKHAVTGLTKAAALEGRRHNIACGQIDIGNAATHLTSALTDGALQADGTSAVEPTMDVAAVAQAVVYMASLPLEANVLFMTVMATQMPYVGRG